jgi:hypothetical protein
MHARHGGPSLEGEPCMVCSTPIEKLSSYALLFAYATEMVQTLSIQTHSEPLPSCNLLPPQVSQPFFLLLVKLLLGVVSINRSII